MKSASSIACKASRIIRTGMLLMAAAISPAAFSQHQGEGAEEREPGVSMRFYDLGRQLSKLRALVPGQTPNISKVVPAIDLRGDRGDFAPLTERFLLLAEGYLEIKTPGRHEFELTSDDGSDFWIDGQKVVNNDNEHGTVSKTGAAELSAGLHSINVRFFQGVGEANLWLKWKTPGSNEFVIVPASALSCHKGEVRVTSPGQKKVVMPLERGSPGDGRPLDGVHPSYTLTTVHPKSFKVRVGGIDWLPDGRMVLCAWEPAGEVYLLSGTAGDDPEAVKVKKIASGLAEPLGVKVVDGRIFVLQKQELTELIDRNHDDVIDEYRCVCSGWGVTANFHEFAFGLAYKDGFFYANLAIAINPGGRSTWPQNPDRGTVVKIGMDGSWKVIARGLRTPNGIGPGVDGELFITDNQGDWLPSSKLMHVHEGAFYGNCSVLGDKAKELAVTQPVVWLPQGEIGNSPSEVIPLSDGPYAGQMAHGDVTYGGLERVFAEKIDGQYQGVVFRMTQGLEGGVNRVRVGPDHAIYVGGIGSTGDWGQEGKLRYGLQRLAYNGKPAFEMLAVRAMTNGFDIEFTEPLAAEAGENVENYFIQQYKYVPTESYGGDKIDLTVMPVKSVTISSDRRHAFLEIPGLLPLHVEAIRLIGDWKSQGGRKLWSTEAWYTLNAVPKDRNGQVNPRPAPPQNALTQAEIDKGWKLLFDGKTTQGWRGYKQKDIPNGWRIEDDCLTRVGPGGDIVTIDEFRDFELTLQWKIAPGGNSGIFTRVQEDGDYVWSNSPEMQVLDDERHPDGDVPSTSAGACYGLFAPPWDASYPAGVFNTARILARGSRIEYFLNGKQMVVYEIGSKEWDFALQQSKFAGVPDFATSPQGHIGLQDHGDKVWYRNIKIRPIGPPVTPSSN